MALTLGDNFSYQGAKPLDARLKYDTLTAMKAVADSTMYDGCLAYCVATDKTYQWKSTNEVDADTGKWREFTSGGDTIQVDTLPTAEADELGKVYQYIGSTTPVYTHGYFYECVSDGAGTPTYSWEEVPTSKGGHDIKNNGVAVTSRDTMNFTDFDIADDHTNKETDVKAHRLTSAEIADICTPLPGAVSDMPVLFDEREAEYVIGWYVLANGTKKPVYAKTFVSNEVMTLTAEQRVELEIANITGLNIDVVVNAEATYQHSSNFGWWALNFANTNPLTNMTMSLQVYDGKISIIGYRSNGTGTYTNFHVALRYTKTTDTPV